MQTQTDIRPPDCRFRLQDEGKSYPRSGCRACGRTVTTGLGNRCWKERDFQARAMDAISKAIDAGTEAVDLYEIAKEDIIRRENLREFFEAALAAWLKAQAAALKPSN